MVDINIDTTASPRTNLSPEHFHSASTKHERPQLKNLMLSSAQGSFKNRGEVNKFGVGGPSSPLLPKSSFGGTLTAREKKHSSSSLNKNRGSFRHKH